MFKFQSNKHDWSDDCYRFFLDESDQVIKGWFVKFNEECKDLECKVYNQDGSFYFFEVKVSLYRPQLSSIFKNISNVEYSGFEVDFDCLNFKKIVFYINDVILATVSKNLPLLFVHVPKTAGTTINSAIIDLFGKDDSLVHVESKPNWADENKFKYIDFISGHHPYKFFMRYNFLKNFRKAISFREPYSHVISHLSWVRALSESGSESRFLKHPEYIKKLSLKLSNFDFSDPLSISKMIESLEDEEFRLFDNTQMRYIRSDISKKRVDEIDLNDSIVNLKDFDFIGIDEDIEAFISTIYLSYGKKYNAKDSRKNVLNNKFGFDIKNEEIKKSLQPLVKYDLALYDILLNNNKEKKAL
ncbi:Sulfotransferase family protein [Marinomonas gallaica]|uniref:Sulfotransferase family protein n=1 Tax=Marinomonas gallaica TaxID=1806667 RepID=A0A1C3JUP1_9GAMM|nr:sulfotransferase family 2 domain-containing protein [Marinomonas gallaica]SBT18944.1 Sulfotransferase family protein [Marinomonas gallaica]SBT21899.1 Sulfotransferase family protein [Marinomonas gallaica]